MATLTLSIGDRVSHPVRGEGIVIERLRRDGSRFAVCWVEGEQTISEATAKLLTKVIEDLDVLEDVATAIAAVSVLIERACRPQAQPAVEVEEVLTVPFASTHSLVLVLLAVAAMYAAFLAEIALPFHG